MAALFEVVTPERAEFYLTKNTTNRTIKEDRVLAMVADLKAGKFTDDGSPIRFYKDGALADGQHRLMMVEKAGIPFQFMIVRGVEREAALNIDTVVPRRLPDNWRIAGHTGLMNLALISACRAADKGISPNRTHSMSQKEAMVEKHRVAGEWVMHHVPKGKNLGNSVISGAMIRAWYKEENKERLAEFSKVLSTGFANGMTDSAAVTLRNYLQSGGSMMYSGTVWRVLFLKVQNCLWYFMRGKQLTQVKGIEEERYPL